MPTAKQPPLNRTVATLMLTFSAACWAGNHIVARSIHTIAPPWSLNLLRWLAVALLMLAVGWKALARDWRLIKRNWLVLAYLGALGGGIFGSLQFVALKYTGALNSGVMNSVGPAMIALASVLIFRDVVTRTQLVGISISLLGVLAIVSKLDLNVLRQLDFNKGDLILVVNMALWSVYSASQRLRPNIALTSFLFTLGVASTLSCLPMAVVEYVNGEYLVFNWPTIGAIAYTSILSSSIAYYFWARGGEAMGATRAGIFLHLVPLFGIVFATTLLGEHLGLHHVVGFALILSGVALAVRRPTTSSAELAEPGRP